MTFYILECFCFVCCYLFYSFYSDLIYQHIPNFSINFNVAIFISIQLPPVLIYDWSALKSNLKPNIWLPSQSMLLCQYWYVHSVLFYFLFCYEIQFPIMYIFVCVWFFHSYTGHYNFVILAADQLVNPFSR